MPVTIQSSVPLFAMLTRPLISVGLIVVNVRVAEVNAENAIDIELLGVISRNDFDTNKTIKRYGAKNPLNYIVGLSKMNEV